MRKLPALIAVAVSIVIAGCGSSSSSSAAPGASSSSSAAAGGSSSSNTAAATTSASASGVNPNQRETLPPGDIPDTIAYIPYAVPGAGLTVSTPEGWSRSSAHGGVKFTDKLNEIQVFTLPASGPVSTASAKNEVPGIAAPVKTFQLQSISSVSRPAGTAVRIAYLGDSPPNPVTGKVGTLAFERYDFFHKGREVVLILSSPKGSDNVDPWRKVTSSLRFTR
jgi:hypothetical protein